LDENFEVDFGEGCMNKYAEERGFLVPTQRLRRKRRKSLIEVAGPRTFRLHTDFYPTGWPSNTRAQTAVPTCAVSLLLRTYRFV